MKARDARFGRSLAQTRPFRDSTPSRLAAAVALLIALGLGCFLAAETAVAGSSAGRAVARCQGKQPTIIVRGPRAKGSAAADVILITYRRGARVNGSGGADRICGGRGDDVLMGGAGNDQLAAGGGRDRLLGGPGRDLFVTRGSRSITDAGPGEELRGPKRMLDTRLRTGSTAPSASDIRTVAGTRTARVFTLARGAPVPVRGAGLVVPRTDDLPTGFVGMVTGISRSRTGLVVTARPAALSEVYSTYRVSATGTLGALVAGSGVGAQRALAAATGKPISFSCSGTVKVPDPIVFNPSNFSANFTLDTSILSPYIGVDITAAPEIGLRINASANGSCTATLPAVTLRFGPVFITLRPAVKLSASGKLELSYLWRPLVIYSFARGQGQDRDDRQLKPRTTDFTMGGEATAHASVKLGVDISVGERLGLNGSLTPYVTGTARVTAAEQCAKLSGAITYGLTAYADVFVRRWSWTLATGEFLRRTYHDRCSAKPGGALGPVPTPPPTPPPPPPSQGVAVAVDAGGDHSCALRAGKTISCWGVNFYGQLGNGSTTHSSTPVSVSGISDAVRLGGAGSGHSCALRAGGTISCWGYNYHGALGDGSTTDSSTPVAVSGISDATQVAGSGGHSCALRGGTISCWGFNGNGQLGDGSTTNSSTPVTVPGISNATQINVSNQHSCALRTGGTISCWGANFMGQLGNASTTGSLSPVTVSGITDATQLAGAGGGWHSCALRADGTISCWGSNVRGELGDGSISDGLTTYSSTPVTVSGIGDATMVTTGDDQSCALRAGGTISCWGANDSGELGNGSTADSSTPVSVYGVSNAMQIDAGYGHVCALRTGGLVSCWGYNGYGQLGDGSTTNSSTPVTVIALP